MKKFIREFLPNAGPAREFFPSPQVWGPLGKKFPVTRIWKKFTGGFSLLEVMVAVAIMAVSFLAVIEYQGQAMRRVGASEQMTTATFLARQKMEETLLEIEKEYKTQRVFPEDKSESDTFPDPYGRFRWEMNIRKVELPAPGGEEGGGDPNLMLFKLVADQLNELLREVKIVVKWDVRGKERKFEVVTHIAKL